MPTSAQTIGPGWSKVANPSDNGVFLSWDTGILIEAYATPTNAAPIGPGHRFSREQ